MIVNGENINQADVIKINQEDDCSNKENIPGHIHVQSSHVLCAIYIDIWE